VRGEGTETRSLVDVVGVDSSALLLKYRQNATAEYECFQTPTLLAGTKNDTCQIQSGCKSEHVVHLRHSNTA